MNYVICILLIPIRFGLSNNFTCNEGASTSGLQQRHLSVSEKCKINAFVDNLLNSIADVHDTLSRSELDDHLFSSQARFFADVANYLRYGSDNNDQTDEYIPLLYITIKRDCSIIIRVSEDMLWKF